MKAAGSSTKTFQIMRVQNCNFDLYRPGLLSDPVQRLAYHAHDMQVVHANSLRSGKVLTRGGWGRFAFKQHAISPAPFVHRIRNVNWGTKGAKQISPDPTRT